MTSPRKTSQFSPATIGQRQATLLRLLSDLPVEDRDSKVLSLVDAIATGQMDARGLWQAERDGELVDALWWLPQPDGVALIWLAPPMLLTDASSAVRKGLLTAACQQMDSEHVAVSQILTEPTDSWSPPLLKGIGYKKTVTLQFWARSLMDQPVLNLGKNRLDSINFEFGECERLFAKVLEETYRDSLDCPEFTPLRTAQQALDCHRQNGSFEPELWRLFWHQEQPVGLALLADHPDQNAVELMYFGIAPSARGQGYGKHILQWAINTGKTRNRETLFLAADTRNGYAERLYEDLGFLSLSQRQVWWRFASPSFRKSLTHYAHDLGTSGNLGAG